MAVAISAPILFPAITGAHAATGTLATSFLTIGIKVFPLIIVPLALAFFLLYTLPGVHKAIASHQSVSFYIWAVSLFIVVGRAVSFIMDEPSGRIPEMAALALVAALMCMAQFYAGRVIGRRCGDRIAGAQGLGQKNTVLAIWMALTYLNPIASVAPAAYVAWQNTINSLQLYLKTRQKGI